MNEDTNATATEAPKKKRATRKTRYDRQISARVPPKVIARLREIQRINELESMSSALRFALIKMVGD